METRDMIREFDSKAKKTLNPTTLKVTQQKNMENLIVIPPTSIFESVELVINYEGRRAKYFF